MLFWNFLGLGGAGCGGGDMTLESVLEAGGWVSPIGPLGIVTSVVNVQHPSTAVSIGTKPADINLW